MARSARLELEVDGRGARRGASEADRELNKLKKTAASTVDELNKLGGGATKAGRSAASAANDFDRMGRAADRAGDSAVKAGGGISGMAGSLRALAASAVVVGGLALAKEFLDISDAAKKMDAQLRLALQPTQSFASAQEDVRRISRETFTSLEATTDLYSKVARASAEMGKSTDDASKFTETFAKTLKISGASAAQADTVTRQFGQALASGVLRGDEFNSIMENGDRLARLLADSLGVPTGALRKMAEEGKLTRDVLYAALTDTKFTETIDEEFRTIPTTFAEAMQRIKDDAGIVFSAFDRGGDFSNMLVNFMVGGTENFGALEDRAEQFGINVRATFEGLGAVFGTFTNNLANSWGGTFDFMGIKVVEVNNFLSQMAGNLDTLEKQGLLGRLLTGGSVSDWWNNAPPSNFREKFDKGQEAAKRSGQASAQDRMRDDMLPSSWTGSKFNPVDFVKGTGIYAPKAVYTAPAESKSGGTKRDPNAEVGKNWTGQEVAALLRANGIRVTDVDRTRAQQQAQIDKWMRESPATRGIRPAGLDGPHVQGKGVDIGKENSIASIRAVLTRAGVPIKQLINEGDHKHLTIGGGRGGGGGKSEAEREAERLAKLAETRKEREAEFFQSLKDQAAAAALLPAEAERFNAELRLREILNDGNKAGEKEITKEQREQIDLSIRQRDTADAIRDIRKSTRDGQFETTRLEERARVIASSTLDTEEDNLAVQERLWPFKLNALERGLDLQDETLKAALAELEARERTNVALERKQRLAEEGVGVAERFKTPGMIQSDELRELGKDRERIDAAREAGKITPELYEAAKRGLEQAVFEVSHRFEYEFIDSIGRLADEFDGTLGRVLGKVARVFDTIGRQSKGDFSGSGPLGAIIGLFNGPNGNPVADAAKQASQDVLKETFGGGILRNPLGSLTKGFEGLKGDLNNIFGKGGDFTKGLGSILGKAAIGQQIGSASNSLLKALGAKSSSTGAQLGGAVGTAVGGPLGGIIGGIGGGLVGGLFKKTKSGSATVTGFEAGDISLGGNSGSRRAAAGDLAGAVQDQLKNIADRLGASLGSFNLAIGQRGDDFRVNPSGGSLKKKKGGVDFGDDADAAVAFAVRNALQDGALTGLSPTIKRAFDLAGDDLEKGISNALQLKGIKDELRQIEDPMNFALEQLNLGFEGIAKLLRAAGGTAQEFADAEKLYQLKRADIIEQGNQSSLKAMRDYLFQLAGGTGSALSPESRLVTTRAELDRLDAQRNSGGVVDFGEYQSKADAFLAASRDRNGSGLDFFADLQRVTSTVQGLIDSDKAKAVTAPQIDFKPVVAAVDSQTAAVTDLLTQIRDGMAGGFVPPGASPDSPSYAVQLDYPRYIDLASLGSLGF